MPASSCAITTASSLRMFISRTSRDDAPLPSCSARMRREGLRPTGVAYDVDDLFCSSCHSFDICNGGTGFADFGSNRQYRSTPNRLAFVDCAPAGSVPDTPMPSCTALPPPRRSGFGHALSVRPREGVLGLRPFFASILSSGGHGPISALSSSLIARLVHQSL